MDSTRTIKGNIIPDFKFQTQRKNLIEFENISDLTFKLNSRSLVTIANKFEITKFGKEVLLSGGYLYAEYRRLLEKKLVLEPYSQLMWSDARGMEVKFASGINGRVRFLKTSTMGLFAGIGPFYEYERWNYRGVDVEDFEMPSGTVQAHEFKIGSYVSWKWLYSDAMQLDISLYHQARPDSFFRTPRLASSSSIRYRVTKNIGFILMYQNIYDPAPLVPIDPLFSRVVFSVEIAF